VRPGDITGILKRLGSEGQPLPNATDSRGDIYVGEVSFTNWGNRYKGEPHPPGLRSLQKLVKV